MGLYQADKFSAKVAWNWRDDYFKEAKGDIAIFQKAAGKLSAAVHYKISKNFKLSLKGQNLTRTESHSYHETLVRPKEFNISDRRVTLSMRYKF